MGIFGFTPPSLGAAVHLSLLLLINHDDVSCFGFSPGSTVQVPFRSKYHCRHCSVPALGATLDDTTLFTDEPELMDVAENFLRAKFRQVVAGLDNDDKMTPAQCQNALQSLLPPVSPVELEREVQDTMTRMEKVDDEENGAGISEDRFVKAVAQNSYWNEAGDLVVMELVYFEALFAYYQTGKSLLENDDYETLKESLTWEGSSIATMSKQEALFVTAVASARRGTPYLGDEEYEQLKAELKKNRSWVTARGEDALEKLGINTFMGYLHRALE